jgi:hypothetical protein
MKKLFLISLLFCLLLACSEENPEHSSGVFIRIRNTSTLDYADVYVDTGGGEFNYESISSKGTTPYHVFESAYRYAYVSLKIDGVNYTFHPIDYVGEQQLANGGYTYEIMANPDGNYDRLTINLVKD